MADFNVPNRRPQTSVLNIFNTKSFLQIGSIGPGYVREIQFDQLNLPATRWLIVKENIDEKPLS